MDPATIVAFIQGAIGVAKNGYELLKQISGDSEIPSWDDLIAGNTEFQKKIDAEKEA